MTFPASKPQGQRSSGGLVKLCGLWKNPGRDGKPATLGGNLSPVARVVILPNGFKRNEKDPDYYLCISQSERPAGGGGGQRSAPEPDPDDFGGL